MKHLSNILDRAFCKKENIQKTLKKRMENNAKNVNREFFNIEERKNERNSPFLYKGFKATPLSGEFEKLKHQERHFFVLQLLARTQ